MSDPKEKENQPEQHATQHTNKPASTPEEPTQAQEETLDSPAATTDIETPESASKVTGASDESDTEKVVEASQDIAESTKETPEGTANLDSNNNEEEHAEDEDENQDEEDDTNEEEETIDFSALSQEELLDTFRKLLKDEPIQTIKKQVDEIRNELVSRIEDEEAIAKEKFIEDGGNSIDFHYNSAAKKAFNSLYFDYKEKREKYYKNLRKDRQANLEKRLELIEALKSLLNTEESIKFGIVGAIQPQDIDYEAVNYSDEPWANEPWQSINYVSCHDNHTLYDKLKISLPDAEEEELIKMDKLANAIVLTSQGVPFLHAGSELLRTKHGEHNSYNLPDSINQIDWSWRQKNKAVFSYIKVQ